MTRQEAKELLPIIQAFAEGKTIQVRINNDSSWTDLLDDKLEISNLYEYRIKSKPKYRPFNAKEECWNEMHKHSDFGWVKYGESICSIQNINSDSITDYEELYSHDFIESFANSTFIDGTPFGIKE